MRILAPLLLTPLLVLAKPVQRRALNGTLSILQGVLGIDTTFDYIVVGGGTGGLAIAYRLAEGGKNTVAVVEAGTLYELAEPVLADTPAGDVLFVGSQEPFAPTVDWGFRTTVQTASTGMGMNYARGKCLGGSSARNFMIYQRGTEQSFDKWAAAVGDQSYTFSNVLPFYQKSVNSNPPDQTRRFPNASVPNVSAGSGGPLQLSFSNYAQPFSTYLRGAYSDIGIPTRSDFVSGQLLGAQFCRSTIDPATENRESSQTSFLDDAAAKKFTNLKVFDLTLGKQILFDSNKKATGVLVQSAALLSFTLTARKEVVLSAGAFQSPQLLMVSGIGPAATLQNFSIPVLVDAPGVGQNMWDHIFFGPAYVVDVPSFTKLANDPVYVTAQFATNYTLDKSGPLTNPVADFLAWEKVPSSLRPSLGSQAISDLSQFPADWPEIEYISGAGYVGDWHSLFLSQPKDGRMYATILATLVAPLSRGTVTIASADTNVLPIIDPAYLSHPTDQKVAIAAFKRARQAFASPTMQKTVKGVPEFYPGPQVQTDDQILTVIKNSIQTVWHASCTTKMGKASDKMAVVDSKARVFGVTGVRVVDAAAFPLLVPGHPQSTIYMLAEKIANDIITGN